MKRVRRWVLFPPKSYLPLEWDFDEWESVTRGNWAAGSGRLLVSTLVFMAFLWTRPPWIWVVGVPYLLYIAYVGAVGLSRQVSYVWFYWRHYRGRVR